MSNQYYSFLATHFLNWVNQNEILPGNRYFLMLDTQEQVDGFVTAIADLPANADQLIIDFPMQRDHLNFTAKVIRLPHKTPKVNIVIVKTDVQTQPDFLVTLRNRVAEQKGIWENTAIIFISDNVLDSINGGAMDISSEDGPFNSHGLLVEIQNKISDTTNPLSQSERQILNLILQQFQENKDVTYDIMDFKYVFTILNNGTIADSDYPNLGMFADHTLKTINDAGQIDDRIRENRTAFSEISDMHNRPGISDALAEYVPALNNSTKSVLTGEDWMTANFDPIIKALSEKRQQRREFPRFDQEAAKATAQVGVTVWDRLEDETPKKKSLKARTHNLLVFVAPNATETAGVPTTFILPFDSPLKESDFTPKKRIANTDTGSALTHQVKGKKVEVQIPPFSRGLLGVELVFQRGDITGSKTIFRILVSKLKPAMLQTVKSRFSIQLLKQQPLLQLHGAADLLDFSYDQAENVQTIPIDSDEDLVQPLPMAADKRYDFSEFQYHTDTDTLGFALQYQDFILPAQFMDEVTEKLPKTALDIELARQTADSSITFDVPQKLSIDTVTVYPNKNQQQFIAWEKQLLASPCFSATAVGSELTALEFPLPSAVVDAMAALRSAFQDAHTLPSLSNPQDEQLDQTVTDYIKVITATLAQLPQDQALDPEVQNLTKLGTITAGDTVYYTPLAPALLQYTQALDQTVAGDALNRGIMRTLNPAGLIPFIQNDGQLLAASYDDALPRWLKFIPLNQAVTNNDTQNIVCHRLKDFTDNFAFLMAINPKFALHIAFRNFGNAQPVLRGVLDYLLDEMLTLETLSDLHPIELYFDDQSGDDVTADITAIFQDFYALSIKDQFEALYGNSLPSKLTNQFSARDIITTLQESIFVYDRLAQDQDYHISFYQFLPAPSPNSIDANNLLSNYAMNGLLATTKYTQVNNLGTGFGLQGDTQAKTRPIINFFSDWNALLAATRTRDDQFNANQTIVNYVPNIDDQDLASDFARSDWVVFMDPRLDIKRFDAIQDLYVIHYSGHEGNTDYRSITVTKRVERYNMIIRETLNDIATQRDIDFIKPDEAGLAQIINAFNLLNGVWLLKILKSTQTSKTIREKLSILAAYKHLLGLLHSEHTYWVPISMEEILRVSGNAGLNGKNGLFSASNLHQYGSTSDDLLLMGIEVTDEEEIQVHLLPAEVKVGQNANSVLQKANEQIQHTIGIFREFVISEQNFTNKFYRNFFLDIFLDNFEKLQAQDQAIQDPSIITDNLIRLRNEPLHFDNEFQEFGNGFVFSLAADKPFRRIHTDTLDNGLTIAKVEVPESDAYSIPAQPLVTVVANIQNGSAGFDLNNQTVASASEEAPDWLIPAPKPDLSPVKPAENKTSVPYWTTGTANAPAESAELDSDGFSTTDTDDNMTLHEDTPVWGTVESEGDEHEVPEAVEAGTAAAASQDTATTTPADIEIPIGKISGGQQIINWAYGNPQLANRHMLVTGKSGQGKTYFMQNLLAELSKKGISSLVIDYTNSYLTSQLDPDFIQLMGDKLHTVSVRMSGVPINPFHLDKINIPGAGLMDEEPIDMVERVVQVLDYVFQFGEQQRSVLNDIIEAGYDQYGAEYTFEHLRKQLTADDAKSPADKIYGRMQPFLKRKLFTYPQEPFNWGQYFNNNGDVMVIQLTGYQQNITSAIIEFLLWDLFKYSEIYGSEQQPLPVFLDEVQNLSFSDDAPTVKILKEGRKFGWSGIFATQSVASIKDDTGAIWNTAVQLHFLPPEDQTQRIAKLITSDANASKDMVRQLSQLSKGRALFNGPIVTPNGFQKVTYPVDILQFKERFPNLTSGE
ncbi:hypothetical protein FC83_GL001829 [Agrilactobacillus composti DSM 18527 = JCM 14202]|uniref:Helicase HerA central domain-containing protein n=1 Tax=Agrilactobacillus composti DSM 18527 = JCM 14202 TaxID=1423734 RepID=X0PMU9_9LACO|nr:DUF87 domain-containing protein [Agrilactobacillus composti]KRM30693.1 hypothetical protein FC83_GL001829 [Agrilactobacillus composti DSM 18527 = JCM 14202]GAF38206.1 cell division protein FtsK [Agrilactobacillus composti DSM 18527 = JCM 14202]